MPEECPNCGAPFSDRVEVDMGDRYENVFGPPPSSLFSRYLRLCPDPEAAARASGSSNVTLEVYLHARDDLESGAAGAAWPDSGAVAPPTYSSYVPPSR